MAGCYGRVRGSDGAVARIAHRRWLVAILAHSLPWPRLPVAASPLARFACLLTALPYWVSPYEPGMPRKQKNALASLHSKDPTIRTFVSATQGRPQVRDIPMLAEPPGHLPTVYPGRPLASAAMAAKLYRLQKVANGWFCAVEVRLKVHPRWLPPHHVRAPQSGKAGDYRADLSIARNSFHSARLSRSRYVLMTSESQADRGALSEAMA